MYMIQVPMGSTRTCAPSRSRKLNMLKLPSPSVVCAQNSPVILTMGLTRRRSTSMVLKLSRQRSRAGTYSSPFRSEVAVAFGGLRPEFAGDLDDGLDAQAIHIDGIEAVAAALQSGHVFVALQI